MKRREFLQLGLGVGFGGILGSTRNRRQPTAAGLPPIPRVNGSINVAPIRRLEPDVGMSPPLIVPGLVDLQMRALYELGFQQIRIMLSFERFGPNFLAAIPYVRAARSLGIDVLGILGQFDGFDLLRALSQPATREQVLETYLNIFDQDLPRASASIPRTGSFAIQVMNEPTQFHGIAPDVYVRDFLTPAYFHLKEDDPQLLVVSAAAVSSAGGLLRSREMLEAGMERVCDRVAYHVYTTRWLDQLAVLSDKPIWITESGTTGVGNHLAWMTSTFDEIRRRIPGVEHIFWYLLVDFDPDGFRLMRFESDPLEGLRLVPESLAAVDWLQAKVRSASGETPRARYEDLIPDITLYFPDEEDYRLIQGTSFAPRG